MLAQARIAAIVPVSDVEAAVRFYGDTLGLRLKERRSDLPENREAEFEAGDGTLLVYESVGAGQSRHTVAGFRVEDLDEVVATLRGARRRLRGVRPARSEDPEWDRHRR